MSNVNEDGSEVICVSDLPAISFSEGQDRVHRNFLEQHTRRMMVATLISGTPIYAADDALIEKIVEKATAMADLIMKATE